MRQENPTSAFFPGNKKPAKPSGLRVSIWFNNLVEAAGIEPASASTPPQGLHAYPALLI